MKKYLEDVKTLYQAGKYNHALNVLDDAERNGFLHPAIFVWRSRCFQLSTELLVHELSQIEAQLKQALVIDEEYLPALIDLAYFYLRVMDDAFQAKPLFEKALEVCVENATEIVVGLGECISETDSKDKALAFLAQNKKLNIDVEKLGTLKAELQE